MNELSEVVRACRSAAERAAAVVMATVVRTRGSSYRRPGARMVFPEVGAPVGFVSGGCLETDLAERALDVLRSGRTRTVVYDMRSPDDIVWGLGLGCNGEVRVLLERIDPSDSPAYVDFLAHHVSARRAGVLVTVFDVDGALEAKVGDRLMIDAAGDARGDIADAGLRGFAVEHARSAVEREGSSVREYSSETGRAEALIEYLAPAIKLLVFGAGRDARPVVRLAGELGWIAEVADNRPAFARRDNFPEAESVRLVEFGHLETAGLEIDGRTAVVVMTHHFLHDLELVRFLLDSPAPYLGLLGPRKRAENLLAELERQGVRARASRERLHGPVGIDIGADSPEEIALAVLAEIQAVLNGRRAGFLRDRRLPLHDWPA